MFSSFRSLLQERHKILVSLLPEIVPELIAERKSDKKQAQTRIKEGVYRGGGLELGCYWRPTDPRYHVIVPGRAQGDESDGFCSLPDTLYVSCRPAGSEEGNQ